MCVGDGDYVEKEEVLFSGTGKKRNFYILLKVLVIKIKRGTEVIAAKCKIGRR